MYFSSNIDTNYTFFGKCNYNKKRIPHNIKSRGIQREKKDKKLINKCPAPSWLLQLFQANGKLL